MIIIGKIISFEEFTKRRIDKEYKRVNAVLSTVETGLTKNPKDRDLKKLQKALLIRKSELENEAEKIIKEEKNKKTQKNS